MRSAFYGGPACCRGSLRTDWALGSHPPREQQPRLQGKHTLDARGKPRRGRLLQTGSGVGPGEGWALGPLRRRERPAPAGVGGRGVSEISRVPAHGAAPCGHQEHSTGHCVPTNGVASALVGA